MMMRRRCVVRSASWAGVPVLAWVAACLWAGPASGEEARVEPAAVESRVAAVTVFAQTALVTRSVDVPGAGNGVIELVVGPLPTSLVADSLYAEGTGGARVLTTRYRQRTERVATDVAVAEVEERIATLESEVAKTRAAEAAAAADLALLERLAGFAQASVAAGAREAGFDAAAYIELSDHIMTRRRELAAEQVDLARVRGEQERDLEYARGRLLEVRAAADRVVREAVIVVDVGEGEANLALSYVVNAAGWRPFYKLRAEAGGEEARGQDFVLESLASVRQRSGEDWTGVTLTLSTANPRLNAAPPVLSPLQVSLVPGEDRRADGGVAEAPASATVMSADQAVRARAQARQVFEQVRARDMMVANRQMNEASAKEAEAEFFGRPPAAGADGLVEGQSVTVRLAGRVSVPWRDDEQLLEIGRVSAGGRFVYNATPVLTDGVYRMAELVNGGDRVILPGPVMAYLDGEFVGNTELPTVAAGEGFTVGMGVDPQLRVERQLVSRETAVRGGNQTVNLSYLIRVTSFKPEAVPLQIWDRMPKDGGERLGVELVSSTLPLSEDPAYLRRDRPRGLLRWDAESPAEGQVEQRFEFAVSYDRNLTIGGLEAR